MLGSGDVADLKQLGGYDILARLSSGGMATLYLGERSGPAGFRKQVAIKVLKGHLARQTKFIEMLIDEARIAARISHPNVVHIEELGKDGDEYFLVMEYLHGVALSELLMALARRGLRLRPAMSVAIAMSCASGLHAAHETRDDERRLLDVIHRDVSPQNILVGARGDVKIIDFGIAKARDRLHVTDAGSGMKGKLRYMAPEQLRGGQLDRRVDIYALGVVLWEMLAMRRLFQGQTDPQVITRIMAGELPPPGAFAEVPFGLDGVVLKCLAADPERRPDTARVLRQMLKEAVPEASTIERGEVAALLWALVGPTMVERAEALPGVAAALQAIELDLDGEEVLARFTEPLREVMYDAETSVAIVPGASEDEATEVSGPVAAASVASAPIAAASVAPAVSSVAPASAPVALAPSASAAPPLPPAGRVSGEPALTAAPSVAGPPPSPPSDPDRASSKTGWLRVALVILLALLVGVLVGFVVLDALPEHAAEPQIEILPSQ